MLGDRLPDSLTAGRKEVAGAATLVERHFQALDEGSFEEAASCFSQDVIYSHPPDGHIGTADNPRLGIEGRQALLEAFRRRAGPAAGTGWTCFSGAAPTRCSRAS